jgi:hypothetical protein
LVLLYFTGYSQINSRIEADVSIKNIAADGKKSLSVGKVFFDKNIRQIVYEMTFPAPTRFAITGKGIVGSEQSEPMDELVANKMIDFSVYNLFLNQDLELFGLTHTPFKMVSTQREADMVISEWVLPEEMGQNLGKMLISQKDKKLYGLVTMGPDEVIISKQFFTDYQVVDGVWFPAKLIQINYTEAGESKKITTFRNIKLNQFDQDANYRFVN